MMFLAATICLMVETANQQNTISHTWQTGWVLVRHTLDSVKNISLGSSLNEELAKRGVNTMVVG